MMKLVFISIYIMSTYNFAQTTEAWSQWNVEDPWGMVSKVVFNIDIFTNVP